MIGALTFLRMTASIHEDCSLNVETLVSNENGFLAEYNLVQIGCSQNGWSGGGDTLCYRILRSNIVVCLCSDGFLREADFCPPCIEASESSALNSQMPDISGARASASVSSPSLRKYDLADKVPPSVLAMDTNSACRR